MLSIYARGQAFRNFYLDS